MSWTRWKTPVLAGLLALTGAASPVGAAAAQDPLKVVTTTTDLAAIARAVGGERVEVRAISAGTQDPHFVEPKPSLILALRDADVFAQVGLGLEVGWAPLLLDQSRNRSIAPGGAGFMDLSAAASVLDVPQKRVTRAEGDVHPFGNPHYWLGPENGKRIAVLFAEKFARLDPEGARHYTDNLQAFVKRVMEGEARWRRQLAPHEGAPVVAYHNSWKYFLLFAGLDVVGYVEPKPGIPPSASHLASLIRDMRAAGARAVIVDPFYDPRVPRLVAERAGAALLVLPSSVGGVAGVDDYVSLLDHNVRRLVEALGG
ncbi:MAG TPA: metal ABC transporter substrate-binding protein [Longimicrobiales bacterium]|nr:metal ABC transporter substrate-binding protein [Longimicrobiales bacterium]